MKNLNFATALIAFLFSTTLFSQISGTVFRDFNENGAQDITTSINEVGIEGVIVKAYDNSGAEVGFMMTSPIGSYMFSGLTLPLRIEFSGFTTGDYSSALGTANKSSVQFYSSPSSSANFGINYPTDFCQITPDALTPMYFNGNPLVENASLKAGLSYAYNSTGTAPAPDIDATQGQIGTAYGIAYNKFTKDAFIGAFIRRHTGLGPLGIGGLYKIDYSGASPVVSSFADLEALGVDFGSIANNVSRGLFGTSIPSDDLTAIAKTLKEGMGDVEISDDGNTLYIVNLFQRNITVIDLTAHNTSGAAITAGNLSTINMPTVTCPNGVARPFGLKYYRGSLFLSVTCTAENAGATIADLDGYVYEYSGGSWSLKVSVPLDFKFWGSVNSTFAVEDPIKWTDNHLDIIDDSSPQDPTVYRIDKKQPMLADIEFDVDGSMIIGALDRTALQFAHFNFFPGTTRQVILFANGDIFRAAKTGSSYTLESGGIAGRVVGCDAQTNNAYPYAGPGGGEFYCGDTWLVDT